MHNWTITSACLPRIYQKRNHSWKFTVLFHQDSIRSIVRGNFAFVLKSFHLRGRWLRYLLLSKMIETTTDYLHRMDMLMYANTLIEKSAHFEWKKLKFSFLFKINVYCNKMWIICLRERFLSVKISFSAFLFFTFRPDRDEPHLLHDRLMARFIANKATAELPDTVKASRETFSRLANWKWESLTASPMRRKINGKDWNFKVSDKSFLNCWLGLSHYNKTYAFQFTSYEISENFAWK